MLDELLKKRFANDNTAVSGSGADKIKADVLSRIERNERHMKHFSIKSVIIAAAAAAVGLTTVAVSVSASVDEEAKEENSRAAEGHSGIHVVGYPASEPGEEFIKEYGEDFGEKLYEIIDNTHMLRVKHLTGMASEAEKNGGITVEKPLDETDVTGFVSYYNPKTSYSVSEEDLEFARKVDEDPESLGLIPVGKSERFQDGLRIVNRHYENNDEAENGQKRYYSFRRVYTDDSENKLLASIYLSALLKFDPEENTAGWVYENGRFFQNVEMLFLDHTENGCCDSGSTSSGHNDMTEEGTGFSTIFDCYEVMSPSGKKVNVGTLIGITSDGVQILD